MYHKTRLGEPWAALLNLNQYKTSVRIIFQAQIIACTSMQSLNRIKLIMLTNYAKLYTQKTQM
ncbi:hypothetical protein D2A34_23950 [Clostridium chromiireducens]|uniref:Uncharacterized protein n=1 Tax=Clostridium chromiireducens TaxID=225345 RepID=A0A399IJ46_9CLOT|nr:hypothetical protein D2A34_23950 [Clostridium chromiireducens]